MREARSFAPQDTALEAGVAGLRQLLRARTATSHDALEQLPLMVAMAEARIDEAAYVRWLRLQWELYAALESRLRPWVDANFAATRLVKGGWLRDDLAVLGHPPATPSVALPAGRPGITREGHAWGILYVLEGSTLGSRMLRDRLTASGLPFIRASRFLAAYGEQTAAMWRDFIGRLGGVPAEEWDAAADAAEGTFAAFHGHFAGARP